MRKLAEHFKIRCGFFPGPSKLPPGLGLRRQAERDAAFAATTGFLKDADHFRVAVADESGVAATAIHTASAFSGFKKKAHPFFCPIHSKYRRTIKIKP